VPHPSQLHRDGWDGKTPESEAVAIVYSLSLASSILCHERKGTPSGVPQSIHPMMLLRVRERSNPFYKKDSAKTPAKSRVNPIGPPKLPQPSETKREKSYQ
jgi:hypothetical protein